MTHSHNEVQFVQIRKKRLLVTEWSFLKMCTENTIRNFTLGAERVYVSQYRVTKTMEYQVNEWNHVAKAVTLG